MTEYQTHMCAACAAGLFEECQNPQLDDDGYLWACAFVFSAVLTKAQEVASNGVIGRPVAAPGDITDATSTGRKRASLLAPIMTGQVCAWSGLRNAGGGIQPIVGCKGHALIEKKGGEDELYQGDRHHGPDKNTLNNAIGLNLHSICVDCHHRWHAVNDKGYGKRPAADRPFLPEQPFYPHDGFTAATDEEYALAEAWWELPVETRGPYPIQQEREPQVAVSEDPATLDPFDNPFPDNTDEIGDLS